MQQLYDEMGSPLDTNLVNKKRLKNFEKPAGAIMETQSQLPVVVVSQNNMHAEREAKGLNLMNSVVTCDHGNSPPISSFNRNFSR